MRWRATAAATGAAIAVLLPAPAATAGAPVASSVPVRTAPTGLVSSTVPVLAGSAARISVAHAATVDAPRPDRRFRLLSLRIDKPVIDVTRAARTVTITVKVSHPRTVVEGELVVGVQTSAGAPTGNFEPGVSAVEVRTRGTVSVFRARLTFPRYAQPSTFDAYVDYSSVRNTAAQVVRRSVLRVTDRDPDLLPPRIVGVRITAQGGLPVDVRKSSKRVRVTLHVVDDRSGPDWTRSEVVLRAVDPEDRIDMDYYYLDMRRVSGTQRDGIWVGTTEMSRFTPTGDWDTRVTLFDKAHDPGDAFSGPLLRDYLPLPGNAGPFSVKGRGDRHRPQVRSVTLSSPATIVQRPDGLPARVTVTAHLVDTGGRGVRRVVADVAGQPVVATRPVSGTRDDGIWRLTVEVPTYLADVPQTYWLHLQVADTHHLRWYVAPGAPRGLWGGEVPLTRAQLGTGTGTVTTTPPAPAVRA